ncbi:MAG TPA: DPP IV N-terminal domain-containing protein [Gemmataceae bacterium]|jgi:dipeptidyl aminopeptidase/acylaminoacyl peptidase|nr:DPP IV N-terminal domain-containing protein [Gemmataceae bacterium]
MLRSAIWLFLVPSLALAQQTVAEKTDYKSTSRHADVIAFTEELAKKSPNVRLSDIGKSGEGRTLPLLILADPPITAPEEAARNGKIVTLIFANIHAGEVDGKEAVLMLARDIATGADKALLKELVVLIVPILNADGNEKIDRKNRSEQNGPVDGVGVRANAAGYDLNRDFIKLETPEVRGLAKTTARWDPAVIVDLHTTNGSYHRYTLTYDGPRNAGADPELVSTVRDKWLPEITAAVEKDTGFKSFFYGNFNADRTAWESYPPTPRYGIQWMALRNRVALLSESYTYAPFKDRVLAGKSFAGNILKYVAAHPGDVRKLIANADKPRDRIPLRAKTTSLGERTVLGFVEEMKDGKRTPTKEPKEYKVAHLNGVEPTELVQRPFAYLIPATFTGAIETLQRHGITVEELREDIELDVQIYKVEKFIKADRVFQKHNEATVEVTSRDEKRKVAAGMMVVRTTQKLGNLAAYLLEPRAEDGLTTWNFFDGGLAEGKDFPVLRINKSVPLMRGSIRLLPEDRGVNKPISLDLMFRNPPNFAGNAVSGITWLDDGEHFLQVKENQLYKVRAVTGRAELFVDVEKLKKSLAPVPGLKPDELNRIAAGPFYRFNPKRTAFFFTHGDELYQMKLDGSPAVRLTNTPGLKDVASYSPDGRFVAFVRAGNLYVVDVETQAERQLTTDGSALILNGKADWVYGEEIFNRRPQAYWWSPDSTRIAFLRFDDGPVNTFTVIDQIPPRQKVEMTPYPKPGDPNPIVKLGVVPVAGGEPVFADQANYSPGDSLICRVGWFPDSSRVFAYFQNRTQTWLDFCTMPAEGGPLMRLFRETTKAWVEDLGEPIFLADGSFVLECETSGWRHLYQFDKAGKRVKPLTQGDWEVRSVHTTDRKDGYLYFNATKDATNAINLYRVKTDGSGLERLTKDNGTHATTVSPTGNMFIDSRSDAATPTQVRLHKMDGAVVRALDTNPVYAREEYKFGAYERVQVKTRDGFYLEGSLVKPPDFDPTKKYPIWTFTYAGPHMPMVRDGFDGRLQDQALATAGIVVFHVDPRSSSGKGVASAWSAYKQLGVQEMKDLDDAMDWLAEMPWVDAKRFGLSGHSYGGYMTSYALTHSKKFSAGIAGAPVTDWRNYDSIYTERYMGTPQDNPQGYDASSAVKAAKNLHGRLLLLHGEMDDNVHVQNTLQFIDELQKAEKEFEVMIYPRARHGLGPGAQRQIVQFIVKAMTGVEPKLPAGGPVRPKGKKGPGE